MIFCYPITAAYIYRKTQPLTPWPYPRNIWKWYIRILSEIWLLYTIFITTPIFRNGPGTAPERSGFPKWAKPQPDLPITYPEWHVIYSRPCRLATLHPLRLIVRENKLVSTGVSCFVILKSLAKCQSWRFERFRNPQNLKQSLVCFTRLKLGRLRAKYVVHYSSTR